VGDKPPRDLVEFMKALRERRGMSIGDVERCMKIPTDTYRHIERRRRPLPDFQHGLIEFVRGYLQCVDATPEEDEVALKLASDAFVLQFAEWLDDVRNRRSNEHE
jgi:hypothetical protein